MYSLIYYKMVFSFSTSMSVLLKTNTFNKYTIAIPVRVTNIAYPQGPYFRVHGDDF